MILASLDGGLGTCVILLRGQVLILAACFTSVCCRGAKEARLCTKMNTEVIKQRSKGILWNVRTIVFIVRKASV